MENEKVDVLPRLPDPEPKAAEMEMSFTKGLIDNIPDWHPMGLPIGAAAQGAVVAGCGDALSGLIARFVPVSGGRYGYSVVKALELVALNWKPVKEFIGKKSVDNGSIIIAYEGLMGLFNIRMKIYSVLAGVVGKLPGGNTAAAETSSGEILEVIA